MRQIIIFLLTVVSLEAFGQDSVQHCFNASTVWSGAGQGIKVNYARKKNKSEWELGLRYHINRPITDNRGYALHHRLYAADFGQHLGLNIGYRRDIRISHSQLNPYWFYNLAGMKMITHDLLEKCVKDSSYTIGPNNDTIITYSTQIERIRYYGEPLIQVENVFGVGISVQAYKNLYLDALAGGGIALIWLQGADRAGGKKFRYYTWEFTEYLRLGLSYKLR
jgi:hypothetical protein